MHVGRICWVDIVVQSVDDALPIVDAGELLTKDTASVQSAVTDERRPNTDIASAVYLYGITSSACWWYCIRCARTNDVVSRWLLTRRSQITAAQGWNPGEHRMTKQWLQWTVPEQLQCKWRRSVGDKRLQPSQRSKPQPHSAATHFCRRPTFRSVSPCLCNQLTVWSISFPQPIGRFVALRFRCILFAPSFTSLLWPSATPSHFGGQRQVWFISLADERGVCR